MGWVPPEGDCQKRHDNLEHQGGMYHRQQDMERSLHDPLPRTRETATKGVDQEPVTLTLNLYIDRLNCFNYTTVGLLMCRQEGLINYRLFTHIRPSGIDSSLFPTYLLICVDKKQLPWEYWCFCRWRHYPQLHPIFSTPYLILRDNSIGEPVNQIANQLHMYSKLLFNNVPIVCENIIK